MGKISLRIPLRQHWKSRNPLLQRKRLHEPEATDTIFSTTTSFEGYKCAQIFIGTKSRARSIYGMASESDGPNALLDHFKEVVSQPLSYVIIQKCRQVHYGKNTCGGTG